MSSPIGSSEVRGSRTRVLMCRATASEKEAIVSAASAAGMSVGRFLRFVALNHRNDKDKDRPSSKQLAQLHDDLRRIGTNINQIAHHINAKNISGEQTKLEEIENDLDRAIVDLYKCFEKIAK